MSTFPGQSFAQRKGAKLKAKATWQTYQSARGERDSRDRRPRDGGGRVYRRLGLDDGPPRPRPAVANASAVDDDAKDAPREEVGGRTPREDSSVLRALRVLRRPQPREEGRPNDEDALHDVRREDCPRPARGVERGPRQHSLRVLQSEGLRDHLHPPGGGAPQGAPRFPLQTRPPRDRTDVSLSSRSSSARTATSGCASS